MEEKYKLLIESLKELESHAWTLTMDVVNQKDLLQETALRALHYSDRMPATKTDMLKWLYVMMRNLAINHMRRLKVFPYPIPIESAEIPYDPPVYDKFIFSDVLVELKNVSRRNQDIIKLYSEGYKYHEIAKIKNMNLNTVKGAIRLVRCHLSESEVAV